MPLPQWQANLHVNAIRQWNHMPTLEIWKVSVQHFVLFFCTNVSWDAMCGWYWPLAMHKQGFYSISSTCKAFILSRTAGLAIQISNAVTAFSQQETGMPLMTERSVRETQEDLQPCYWWCPHGTHFHTSLRMCVACEGRQNVGCTIWQTMTLVCHVAAFIALELISRGIMHNVEHGNRLRVTTF